MRSPTAHSTYLLLSIEMPTLRKFLTGDSAVMPYKPRDTRADATVDKCPGCISVWDNGKGERNASF